MPWHSFDEVRWAYRRHAGASIARHTTSGALRTWLALGLAAAIVENRRYLTPSTGRRSRALSSRESARGDRGRRQLRVDAPLGSLRTSSRRARAAVRRSEHRRAGACASHSCARASEERPGSTTSRRTRASRVAVFVAPRLRRRERIRPQPCDADRLHGGEDAAAELGRDRARAPSSGLTRSRWDG